MPFSGERTTCEPSFAHPTMQSPQKSLAPDEPKYLLSRARGDKNFDTGFAPIPAIRRSPLGRQARPKAHLLGSRPNRENI
jgi:hypothetical protein